MRRLLICAALLLALPATAGAYTMKGHAFGHGIGLSQWGAYGYALHGRTYTSILHHYYVHTTLGKTSPRQVRVLLQEGRGAISFAGVSKANGTSLKRSRTYTAKQSGDNVALYYKGDKLNTFNSPLKVSSSGHSFRLGGTALNGVTDGAYRGRLELHALSGLSAVNELSLDNYLKGVVPGESPASWPADALKAQAVAARSYAITTSRGGSLFDQYPDTRSQVYRGMDGEDPRSSNAVEDTHLEVVVYNGQVATTYFFSSSGGRTENIENVWPGSPPVPYLKSVKDPYDYYAPRHKWTIKYTLADVRSRLSGLIQGKFRGIRAVKRGVSPRIVSADVVGTKGATRVTGATLKSRLSLYDTWVNFPTFGSKRERALVAMNGR
jgi:stage II sporulation protein D